MQATEHVLLLGPSTNRLALLAERMRVLGHSTYHCETAAEAPTLLDRDGVRLKMAFVDASLADATRIDLAPLTHHTEREGLVCVGVGDPPAARTRQRLRAAGVELALWEPAGDHALRFQTNRALAGRSFGAPGSSRSETRVPTEWEARVVGGARAKFVSVYSLSSGGAFLATTRPSPRGATLKIELPLPAGRTTVEAEVVYTNVPGNLRQEALPDGMAIRFRDDRNDSSRRSIHYSVASSASRLVV